MALESRGVVVYHLSDGKFSPSSTEQPARLPPRHRPPASVIKTLPLSNNASRVKEEMPPPSLSVCILLPCAVAPECATAKSGERRAGKSPVCLRIAGD